MKAIGVGLLVFGLIFGVFALNMDTSIATKAQSVAGIEIPSVRVNNLGLMNQQQNYLILSGLVALAGVGLTVAGVFQQSTATAFESGAGSFSRRCPFCAESIKREAIVCRYCGREIPPASEVLEPSEASAATGRIEALHAAVTDQSRRVRAYGDDYPAGEVFELGRRWALLFDETRDVEHRSKALAAMTRARIIDPEYGTGFFGEGDRGAFGTLETDPDFSEFA